mmetsp:Transcript_10000/g.31496  ORF Transcript_10000/g.31496 Transcript_10000/m.31496 type:complete len:245 (-) Transcript_10000:96-830(-)
MRWSSRPEDSQPSGFRCSGRFAVLNLANVAAIEDAVAEVGTIEVAIAEVGHKCRNPHSGPSMLQPHSPSASARQSPTSITSLSSRPRAACSSLDNSFTMSLGGVPSRLRIRTTQTLATAIRNACERAVFCASMMAFMGVLAVTRAWALPSTLVSRSLKRTPTCATACARKCLDAVQVGRWETNKRTTSVDHPVAPKSMLHRLMHLAEESTRPCMSVVEGRVRMGCPSRKYPCSSFSASVAGLGS